MPGRLPMRRLHQFCEHYRRWVKRLSPTMRQVHRAGRRLSHGYRRRLARPEFTEKPLSTDR
jgi:hypothetical protein